jgi:glycine hydroxymethyltransferase
MILILLILPILVISPSSVLADVVTTTTHKTLRGPRAAMIFVRKDERGLDKKIDKAVFPGIQGGPHINQIAGVAVTLKEANSSMFKKYARQVIKNAKVLAEELQKLGWRIVSKGTESHLILVDTWNGGIKISTVAYKDQQHLLDPLNHIQHQVQEQCYHLQHIR